MAMDWKTIEMVCSPEFWRMAVLWTLALLFSYFDLLIAGLVPSRRRRRYPRRPPSLDPTAMKRPICIITGATSGLGAAAASSLAGEGFHVVLAGRCPQLLYKTIQEIKQQHKDACLNAFQIDLSSIHSIMKFEKSIRQWFLDSDLHPSVQLLINNAGILATSYRATPDGFDQMLETNYIGVFALSNLLLPLLKNSPVPSRIVNVTSFTHRSVSDMEVDDEALARRNHRCLERYPFARTYEYSKWCLLLFSYELHRQICAMEPSPNVSVTSADPGAVETNIMREIPPCLSRLAFRVLRVLGLLQSPERGVAAIIDAALAPRDASGEYFFGGKGRTIRASSLSYNAVLAAKLWSSSFMLFQEARGSLHETMKDPDAQVLP